jgi:LysR family transcriptional regulator, carnitine catabolism transcriptional activator
MNLSARDLRAVIALVEERNFTRAAERVHLSQPAFSALIQGVEESLGAKLFDRTTRNVALTAEGKVFEQSARRMLADFEGMVADFRDHAQRRKGRVAVAALPSLAAGWFPGVLADFHRSYPGIELALFDSLSEQCLSLLRSRQVDFAMASAGAHSDDLETHPLCQDSFHLICRKDHPLATQASVRPRDLAAYPFVQMSRNTSVRQRLEAAFHPMEMRTILEVEHLATVTGLVRAGLGITLVPALTLFHFDHPDIVVRPVDVKGLQRELVLVRRRHEQLSLAAQALWDMVLKQRPAGTLRGRRNAGHKVRSPKPTLA